MRDLVHIQFSPPPDNTDFTERVAGLFPYELILVLVMAVLLPLTDAARTTGPGQSVDDLRALFFKLPCLVVMFALCVSVVRNQQRSGVAKLFGSIGAVIVICLLYTPIGTLFRYFPW